MTLLRSIEMAPDDRVTQVNLELPPVHARRATVLMIGLVVALGVTIVLSAGMGQLEVAGSLIETDLAAFPSRVYMSLSGGERSRAALARVLAQEPRVLLLDEPTSSLDIRHQQLVMGLTRLRARRGDGVVVVLHDLSLAGTFADRVVVMSQGRIVADGPPDHVLTSQLLSEVYEHPIEIIRHPVTGGIIVVPWHDEDPAATGTSAALSGSFH